MKKASNFPQIRIDKSSLFIAAIAPLLWVVDSFRSAIFLNESFVKQLIFPDSSALFLRLLLVFFILIQAWFFNRYSRTRNRVFEVEVKLKSLFDLARDALVVTDIEGRVLEASGKAKELWGYSLQELSDLDLSRLCAANESERLLKFIREIIENKESGLENVMLAVKDSLTIPADIEGRFIDNLDAQDKPGIFLSIARHKNIEQSGSAVVVAPEVPLAKSVVAPEALPANLEPEVPAVNLDLERSRIENLIRQEEAKKAQEAQKNLEQKYLELMRARLAEECKKVEDAVRLEERKKTEEQIRKAEDAVRLEERKKFEEQGRTLESKASQEVEEKLKQERGRIEETIKQEEAKKFQDQMSALEQKYTEILKARVAEARQQAEEMIGQEIKRKYEEQLRQAEAKFASESGVKISEGRKLIEDSVRLEEQRKAEETEAALRQKYEELLRKGIEDERKRSEESTKLARSKIEEAVRQEEKIKREEEMRDFEVKYADAAGIKMSEERVRIETAARKEEQQKALEAINELKLKYEETLRKAIEEERARAEVSVKDEEKKAQAAIKAIELQYQAKAKESKVPEIKVPEISKLVSGVGQQMMSPLSSVLNYLKVVKIKLTQGADFKPSEFKDTINLMEENALLCKNILNSLADPSRAVKAAFQSVSLNDVIAKIDTLLGQELRLQNITVSKALQANLANISGDPLLLTQVVFNLISNAKWAIKNNPYAGGGTLVIKTRSGKDSVELLITDNGAGIPEKNLPHIFEPFFTTKPDGLGLGLTIANSIIKEHKGEIQVDSKEGIGSTFKVIIPALN